MTINLSDNSPRISYSVAAGVVQSTFTVPFEFFAEESLNVYVDSVLKTLTTDYTTTGGNGTTGSVLISVTGASGGSTVVITREIPLERTTDFPTSGPFQISALNTELDRIVAIAADVQDKSIRSIRAADSDATASYTLPLLDDRKGTVLGFNATSGNVEVGPKIADVQSLSNVSADIALLADIEDGTTATNAITNVNNVRTHISTLGPISSDITTVSGVSSNVTTVAGISANVTTVSGISSDVTTLAGISSDVTTAANNDANITTVAGISSNVTTVAGVSGDVTSVAGISANVTSVAGVTSDVTTVAGISGNVSTVAGISADVTTVAADGTDIGIVAGISANVTAVAGVSSDVAIVSGISADVTTVAADGTDIGAVAGISSDVTSVAGVSANVTTVAGISANVTTVAGISADVTTVAANITDVNTFAERYRVESSDPSTSLDAGDLAFNTTSSLLKYYNGTSWETIAPGLTSVAGDSTPQLGGDLDGNGFTVDLSSNDEAISLPSGTTAQRPTPANGMLRYNSDDAAFEGYADGAWGAIGGSGDIQTATTTSVTETAIATYTASASLGVEITVIATDTVATERTITKLLVTHDGTTAVATQYGEVNTNTAIASYDVDISGGNVRILATAASTNSTNFTVNAVILA